MAAATPSATWTRQYDYAEPGFLEREVVTTATGVTTTEYVPDAAFNRASRTVTTGSGSVTTTYAYDPGNRLATVDGQPVDWNSFGETVTDHRGWDIDRAADGAEVALVDAAGIPAYGFTRGPGGEAIEVEESASGDTRSFLWGPSEADFPVSILDETGTDHLYVAAEGMVLGRVEGGALVPMAQDGLGSVVLDGVDLLPEPGAFGETPAPASAERRVYALLESLPGTSYHLPRRRLYDSDTGRFASADPIGLLGGDNRFAYLSGNPTAGVDPSGLFVQAVRPSTSTSIAVGTLPSQGGDPTARPITEALREFGMYAGAMRGEGDLWSRLGLDTDCPRCVSHETYPAVSEIEFDIPVEVIGERPPPTPDGDLTQSRTAKEPNTRESGDVSTVERLELLLEHGYGGVAEAELQAAKGKIDAVVNALDPSNSETLDRITRLDDDPGGVAVEVLKDVAGYSPPGQLVSVAKTVIDAGEGVADLIQARADWAENATLIATGSRADVIAGSEAMVDTYQDFDDAYEKIKPAAEVAMAAAMGGMAAGGGGPTVTEEMIRDALRDAPLKSQQAGGISMPRVQAYVDKLAAGEVAPAIKVDGQMIVDGNHRYVAGRIMQQEPPIQAWAGGRPEAAVDWQSMPIDPEGW